MLCNCTVELSGNSSRGDHWSRLGKVMHTFLFCFVFFYHTVAFKGRVDAPLFVQIRSVKVVIMGARSRPLNRTLQIWKLLLQTPYYIHLKFCFSLWTPAEEHRNMHFPKSCIQKRFTHFLDRYKIPGSSSSLSNNRNESHKHYTLACVCGVTEQSFRLPAGYESIYLKDESMKGFVYVQNRQGRWWGAWLLLLFKSMTKEKMENCDDLKDHLPGLPRCAPSLRSLLLHPLHSLFISLCIAPHHPSS